MEDCFYHSMPFLTFQTTPLRPAYIQTGPPGQPAALLPVKRAREWGRECLKLSWTSVCPAQTPRIFSPAWVQAAVMKVTRNGRCRRRRPCRVYFSFKVLRDVGCCSVAWVVAKRKLLKNMNGRGLWSVLHLSCVRGWSTQKGKGKEWKTRWRRGRCERQRERDAAHKQAAVLSMPTAECSLCFRCFHLHDVWLDHMVPLQRLLWDGNEIQGEIRKAVPWGRLHVQSAYWRDWEVYCKWGML